VLGDSDINVLADYGSGQYVEPGEILFTAGDDSYDLIVVLRGRVRLVEWIGTPKEQEVIGYGPREFLGEMGMLTGQRAYLTAEVTESGKVLRIPIDRVRDLMATEEHLSELILRAFLLRHARLIEIGTGIKLLGSRYDQQTRRLLELLARNRISSTWIESESEHGIEMRDRLGLTADDLPMAMIPGSDNLINPSNRHLLEALGLACGTRGAGGEGHGDCASEPDESICDLLVVGAGPAGLGAAVYGASEGLETMLAEDTAVGGQAGTSTRIENYLGFPAGLSGEELSARGSLQADKFGVRTRLGKEAMGLGISADGHVVRFEDGTSITARALIISTGARYNRLPLERLPQFEGMGVYYAATQMEAIRCAGRPAVVVGGGNSAGQAALFLARSCSAVHIAIRRQSLEETMSRYLLDEIAREPRISVHPGTEVEALVGEDDLEAVTLRDNASGEVRTQECGGLFVFIGAAPCTAWLDGQLAEDEHGFLLTGRDVSAERAEGGEPLVLETSRPGIFCVGDARSGSIKRVAAAIGEGSMAVRLAFERLQEAGGVAAPAPVPAQTA
jgi:thioredoxin reductase (NADPH)